MKSAQESIVNRGFLIPADGCVFPNAGVGQLTFSGGACKIQELTKGTTV